MRDNVDSAKIRYVPIVGKRTFPNICICCAGAIKIPNNIVKSLISDIAYEFGSIIGPERRKRSPNHRVRRTSRRVGNRRDDQHRDQIGANRCFVSPEIRHNKLDATCLDSVNLQHPFAQSWGAREPCGGKSCPASFRFVLPNDDAIRPLDRVQPDSTARSD